jgi:hypothetical protein
MLAQGSFSSSNECGLQAEKLVFEIQRKISTVKENSNIVEKSNHIAMDPILIPILHIL